MQWEVREWFFSTHHTTLTIKRKSMKLFPSQNEKETQPFRMIKRRFIDAVICVSVCASCTQKNRLFAMSVKCMCVQA